MLQTRNLHTTFAKLTGIHTSKLLQKGLWMIKNTLHTYQRQWWMPSSLFSKILLVLSCLKSAVKAIPKMQMSAWMGWFGSTVPKYCIGCFYVQWGCNCSGEGTGRDGAARGNIFLRLVCSQRQCAHKERSKAGISGNPRGKKGQEEEETLSRRTAGRGRGFPVHGRGALMTDKVNSATATSSCDA